MHSKLLATVIVIVVLLTACENVVIEDPQDGTLVDTTTVAVSGVIHGYDPDDPGTLDVDGIATPIADDGSWTQDVAVDTSNWVTEVVAEYTMANGTVKTDNIAVVYSPSKMDDGELSPDGVGMQFTNTGLTALGPVIEDLAGGSFDVEPMLLAQNPILNTDFEILLGITANVVGNVYEAGFDSVGLTTSATAGGMATDISISNFYIGLDLDISGFGSCKLELDIPTTTIDTLFDLEPDPADPSTVDVNMIGSPNVSTSGLGWDFISGVCDPDTFLIGGLVSSIAGGEIEGSIDDAFNDGLGDPDGAGPADSPLADAIEAALADLSIAGEVGSAVNANLAAPIRSITESASGLDLRSDADFYATTGTGPTDCLPPAGAPDIPSTVDIPGTYPTLGATTPGGDPYGIGLVISASAFNQLLGAMAECGAINQDVTELDLGGGPIPLTSDVLMPLIPELAEVPGPGEPMMIRVHPGPTAPFLTDQPGPNGEMGELYLADLQLDFFATDLSASVPILTIGMDAPMGFDLAYDSAAAELQPTIVAPAPEDITARVTNNVVGANADALEVIFPQVFPLFASDLGDTFAAFPLPGFLGMQFDVVELERTNDYFVLYGDLQATPQTRLENTTISNLSDGDYEEDDTVSDSSQWRSKLRKTTSSTRIDARYRALIGADACCTFDDEEINRNGTYRMEFDVVPENGDTWRLDVAHNIVGAHTGVDDAGGRARSNLYNPSGFSQAVVGRVSTNGGASWTQFNFNPSDLSMDRGSTGQEQFSGSNATFLTGTTQTHVIVEFRIRLRARSESYAPFSSQCWAGCGGDEAAIRLGLNDTLTNGFTAGEYPGVGGRNVSNDGHFASIVLSTL